VEHLVRLGAWYLIDQASPLWLANGLRHYQRMLGFRLVRFRLKRVWRSRSPGPPNAQQAHPVYQR